MSSFSELCSIWTKFCLIFIFVEVRESSLSLSLLASCPRHWLHNPRDRDVGEGLHLWIAPAFYLIQMPESEQPLLWDLAASVLISLLKFPSMVVCLLFGLQKGKVTS